MLLKILHTVLFRPLAALFLALYLILPALPAQAQFEDFLPAARDKLVDPDEIAHSLSRHGVARVIVEFNFETPRLPSSGAEVDLSTREGVAALNARVREGQDRLLSRVLSTPPGAPQAALSDSALGLHIFQSTPLIAVNGV